MSKKTSTQVDSTLDDTFPASDPSSGNMGSEQTLQERKRKLQEAARLAEKNGSAPRRPSTRLPG